MHKESNAEEKSSITLKSGDRVVDKVSLLRGVVTSAWTDDYGRINFIVDMDNMEGGGTIYWAKWEGYIGQMTTDRLQLETEYEDKTKSG